MRSIFVLAFLVNSAFASMKCIDRLLPLPRHSAVHQLSTGEWARNQLDGIHELDANEATRAFNSLVYGKLFCEKSEIRQTSESSCVQLDSTQSETLSCYITTNLGFFIINRDYQNNANIIFQRYRRLNP